MVENNTGNSYTSAMRKAGRIKIIKRIGET